MALIKIASLWNGKGKSLYSGMLDSARLVILANSKKKGEKSPDAFVYIAADDRKKDSGASNDSNDTTDDDDIPF